MDQYLFYNVGRAILIKGRWYLKDEIERQQIILLQNGNNFELEENAHLTHFRFQDESFQSNHTSFSGYSLNKYSNLNCNCLSIGSELYRHNIKV